MVRLHFAKRVEGLSLTNSVGLPSGAQVVVLARDEKDDLLDHGLVTLIVLHDDDLPAADKGSTLPPATSDKEVVTNSHYCDGQQFRLLHWRRADAEKIVGALSQPTAKGPALTADELRLLALLRQGTVLLGDEWYTAWCLRLRASGLVSEVRSEAVRRAEAAIELATVLLTRGNTDAAVLAARQANEGTADAVLADAGQFPVAAYHRRSALEEVRAAGHPAAQICTGSRFWAVECMQGYEDHAAEQWVSAVLRHCLTALAALFSADVADDLHSYVKDGPSFA